MKIRKLSRYWMVSTGRGRNFKRLGDFLTLDEAIANAIGWASR
jgi:hypothetical protein